MVEQIHNLYKSYIATHPERGAVSQSPSTREDFQLYWKDRVADRKKKIAEMRKGTKPTLRHFLEFIES